MLIIDCRDELGRGGLAHPGNVLVHYRDRGGLKAQVNKVIEADERDFFSDALARIMTGLQRAGRHHGIAGNERGDAFLQECDSTLIALAVAVAAVVDMGRHTAGGCFECVEALAAGGGFLRPGQVADVRVPLLFELFHGLFHARVGV